MPLSGHLKISATIVVSTALALSATLIHLGSQKTPQNNCGSLNRYSTATNRWANFSPYAQTDRIWDFKGSPVGLFAAEHEGQPVGLFGLFINGDLSDVKNFVTVDPQEVFSKDTETLHKVGKIQSYLSSHWLAYDPNNANAQASQLALWSVVHSYDYTKDLVEEGEHKKSWETYIKDEVRAIDDAHLTAQIVPNSISVRLIKTQWEGYIGLDVSAFDISGKPLNALTISAQTAGTTASNTTDKSGHTHIYLGDPAPGWAQTIVTEWRSIVPAGTLLKVVYGSKHRIAEDSQQGYVLTAQPIPVRAWVTVYLPDRWCQT